MRCCHCQGIESWFDAKTARRDLERYRKKGPLKTSRLLLDALEAEGIEGATLLDIGGGVGILQHELLEAGAAEAIAAEVSTAYLEAARQEAQRRGHAERIRQIHGDFVERATDIPEADLVTLDRVICCYPDVAALVDLSSARARRFYGVVYPRDRWWIRLALKLPNLVLRLRRNPFRLYVHPTETVDSIVRRNGLERRYYRKAGVWQVAVYGRTRTSEE